MKPRLIVSLLLLVLAAACAPSNGGVLSRITPLPDGLLTSTPPAPTMTLLPKQTVASDSTELAPVSATPLPLNNDLPMGSAMEIAAATDTALQPTARAPISFEQTVVPITFDEFYDGFNMRTGLVLSDKLVSLDGNDVMMEGYMAPPLKPELDYFVLTRVRLAFCPFCSTAGDWPDDIALVYLVNSTVVATEKPIRVTGRIEVGASIDQETGMVSLVRIYANDLEVIG